jgi:hypothetical protein
LPHLEEPTAPAASNSKSSGSMRICTAGDEPGTLIGAARIILKRYNGCRKLSAFASN